ncbi:MAG: YfhO family protein [Lachnospira sp.]|nr:YfhO family protein [Lachnospira sp.]
MNEISQTKINNKRKIRKRVLRYIGIYSLIFVITAILVFSYNFVSGKTFIWKADGWEQHFKALLYYADYLKEFFYKLFVEHRIEFNQWDFAIGEGGDVLNTLNYYVIGDPFAFFAFLVPSNYMYIFYEAMILLRLYLAGLAFSWLCFSTRRVRTTAVLTGAITYVFCYWGMFNALRHPYFLNPMIYFPLLILGVEKILKGRRPYLFIAAVFVTAISNFYFFYMQVLLTVAYVFVRLIYLYKKDIKKMLTKLGQIALASIVAVIPSAIIVMPVLNAFLSDSRFKTATPFYFVYPVKYYLQMISNYVSEGDSYWLCMGYAIPTVLAVILLFIKRKKNTLLKIYFFICFIIMIIPFFGQVLNGLSYMCNRWSFAFALLNAYVLVVMWESLLNIKAKEGLIMLIVMVVYMGLCMFIEYARNTKSFSQLMLGFVLLIVLMPLMSTDAGKPVISRKTKQICILIVAIISIAVNSFYKNSVTGENYVSECVSVDDLDMLLYSNENTALLTYLENTNIDKSFVRYTGSDLDYNSNMLYGLSSSQYYWTLTNQYVSRFRSALGITLNTELPHKYIGYDDRTYLLSLSSTQYYLVDLTKKVQIPNGFVYIGTYMGYKIYRNVNALPLTYSYDSYVTEDQVAGLNGVELQEVMMNSIVLSDSQAEDLSTEAQSQAAIKNDDSAAYFDDIDFSSESLDYTINCNSEDVSVQNNSLVVTKAGASITINFTGKENTETYFVIDGMNYSNASTYELYYGDSKYDPLDLYNSTRWNSLDYSEQATIFSDWLFHKISSTNVELSLTASNGATKNMRYFTPSYSYYNGEEDFCVNMGYSNDAVNSITITFPKVGIYSYDDIKIMSQETDRISSYVNKLSANSLDDMEIGIDTVTGNVSLDSAKFLTFAIPYSKGWKAYVDGEEVDILEGNLTYMAIYVTAGDHEIKLVYNTPLFDEGKVVSFLGIILLGGYIFVTEQQIRKKRKGFKCIKK